ncbi:MAG: ATP-binding cassette domain-containing protein [Anaerolineae bacterium]|uniref:ABC transporter ATP-binding protein n=1 Tax=Promineifilum sp. TaxID=2664178 RepID=UPI001DD0F0A2|nr:ATP-binding cassette domain-containing protein [Anaerolineales bacterium]MCB8936628.1 ATP-binding cassette domain-containing protein [Promineifilum sp.]MCO5178788.1 ATP-binding cassette domain-containing protein [Promineifilum sp.]MCW5846866.1 ATP-binding cassette domain-containing protein [Anaerolineae bacterium]
MKANDGISMVLEPGKIYALVGENGAGKSTLMKILSGYQPPTGGEILLDGRPVEFHSPADALAKGVGMLYQDPLDMPPFRVIDNYLLGRDSRVRLNYKDARTELENLAQRYNFHIDPNATIDSLSMGERQQLELVRLLAGGAQVLILDEPTTGISAEQKEILFESMRKMTREEGKTVILVSHKLEEVQELCLYAYVLRRGRLEGEQELPCLNEALVEMMFGQVPQRTRRPAFAVGEPVLELQDVSIESYQLNIPNINLSVRAGEIFGFAGLEGSGQRQVMQVCSGLLSPTGGRVRLNGEDVTGWSFHRRQRDGMGYVPAGRLEEGLVAGLTLTEHLVLARPDKKFFVDWKANQVEMGERISTYQIVGRPETTADALSGGNQQRLLFSLLNTPLKLLLLEHPTRGLDVRSADYTWQLLYKRREHGTAILFISADLDEIIEHSDRIAVFSGGVMSRVLDTQSTTAEELGHLIGGQA